MKISTKFNPIFLFRWWMEPFRVLYNLSFKSAVIEMVHKSHRRIPLCQTKGDYSLHCRVEGSTIYFALSVKTSGNVGRSIKNQDCERWRETTSIQLTELCLPISTSSWWPSCIFGWALKPCRFSSIIFSATTPITGITRRDTVSTRDLSDSLAGCSPPVSGMKT